MSLFGQLYKWYKEKHIVHSQEEFLKLVFGNDTANSITSPNFYSQIFKQDIPHGFISDTIKNYSCSSRYELMRHETTKKIEYKEQLISILSEQQKEIEDAKDVNYEYSLQELKRLLAYIEQSNIETNFDRITFDFLYWCFIKRLADDFSFVI